MLRASLLLLTLLLTLPLSTVRADSLVLIHGYLSGAPAWDASGVTAALEAAGWHRGGVLTPSPAGAQLLPAKGAASERRYYTVELPSEAPVMLQSDMLAGMVGLVTSRHPGDPLILAGHSAGGVVARLMLVRHGAPPGTAALITIASPNLGTVRAAQALDAVDVPFPLSILADFVGGSAYHTLDRSRYLLVDLLPPRPGSLLYWLNAQPHPDIGYFSIVRGQTTALWGDELVPGPSQDLNNVPVLRGKAQTYAVPTGHALGPLDGPALVKVLESISGEPGPPVGTTLTAAQTRDGLTR